VYWQPERLDPAVEADLGAAYYALPDVLAQSDIVSLHAPHTSESEGLIGERELRLLRPDTLLVNTARGGLIDQDALCRALGERRIGGAALDVYREEPLPRNSPLRTLDNVLLTPHIAGGSDAFLERGIDALFDRFRRLALGAPLELV
jgi:phosphoglycerate dehydrogenase-like enzyme